MGKQIKGSARELEGVRRKKINKNEVKQMDGRTTSHGRTDACLPAADEGIKQRDRVKDDGLYRHWFIHRLNWNVLSVDNK